MNQDKFFPLVTGFIIIAMALSLAFFSSRQSKAPAEPVVQTEEKEYPLYTVTLHNKADDCWTIINGGVYDLTSWIEAHPGGSEAILGLCGLDGSDSFNEQHAGQENPEEKLAELRIGKLKE